MSLVNVGAKEEVDGVKLKYCVFYSKTVLLAKFFSLIISVSKLLIISMVDTSNKVHECYYLQANNASRWCAT